jgi:hypothetical protein
MVKTLRQSRGKFYGSMVKIILNGILKIQIQLGLGQKIQSVEVFQQNSQMVDDQIDEFGKEFRSAKENIWSLMANDLGSTKIGERFMCSKEIVNGLWSMSGGHQI